MARGTAADHVQKWTQNTVAAVNNGYVAKGVDQYVRDNPNNSPGQRAAAQHTLWLSQIQKASGANGKWATATRAVSSADWQAAMTGKGIGRIVTGVQAQQTQDRFTAFMGELMNYIGTDPSQKANLPPKTGDLNGGIARAQAWITYMSKFKPTGVR